MIARRRWGALAAAVLAGVLAIGLGPLAAVLLAPSPARAQDGEGFVQTEYGPLGPADRDLLVRVRLAGLWEIPAGQLAAEQGTNEQIREIGQFIAEEHTDLDEQAREVAETLGVSLPDQPHPDHQVFLDRMASRTGDEFDLEFIQRLREAHGQIYPLIAYVRAGTQNELIRQFADASEEFVGRHMEYLESSGLVDWFHIPPPPEPAGTQSRFLASDPAGVSPVLIWALLGAAAVAGTVTVIRTVRPR
jgi:predicted outer membrane protein